MPTKIYTKKGDFGLTNLYDTKQLNKNSNIFDALGDLDELSANIGFLCSNTGNIEHSIVEDLRWIQIMLLNIGSDISTKNVDKHILKDDTNISLLEERTDFYNEKCSKLTEFILLGSKKLDSICHICRTITRRAERNLWKSSDEYNISEYCFQFINRLSSFFFSLARYLSGTNEVTRSMYDKNNKYNY